MVRDYRDARSLWCETVMAVGRGLLWSAMVFNLAHNITPFEYLNWMPLVACFFDRENSGYRIVSTQGVLKLLKTSWAAMEDFPGK